MSDTTDMRMELVLLHNLDSTDLRDALMELMPLLEARAQAKALISIPQTDAPLNRHRAKLAAFAKSELLLESSLELVRSVTLLATSETTADEIGFPEFADGAEEGMFD